ncbi:hypothetical protein JYU34_013531 [Plutella xylostella]|uniref:CWF19-like protein 2 n=1 Tax=Plutella xylostella TaxID=51655 RepID=A0ABQ7QBB5_PLUXY|nr:hypothetical protein JYU34_013531 [Plutella xylostella]
MKEKKKNKEKRSKHQDSEKHSKKKSRRSSSSESDEWVEQEKTSIPVTKERDDWMAMTGMLKTYTKEDIKPKREEKNKPNIDSYNPATCSRELNPYWKDGGTGLPQSSESFKKSRPFIKASNEDDYYSRSSHSRKFIRPNDDNYYSPSSEKYKKPDDEDDYYASSSSRYKTGREHHKPRDDDSYYSSSKHSKSATETRSRNRDETRYESSSYKQSSNWRVKNNKDRGRQEPNIETHSNEDNFSEIARVQEDEHENQSIKQQPEEPHQPKQIDGKYLSDEKMNKLAAKIVKAEIMGDMKVVNDLKAKLEAAREYRKQNPDAGPMEVDEGVILMSTNAMGNSRPLTKTSQGDARSKGGKRKAETHSSGERQKYFGNDDKYNLAQMFEQEKYGTNYDNDAQLANITAKHRNPNDDLEDIFTDEISKNSNVAKDEQKEKDRAIKQHVRMEKSLEGCLHCVDSRAMIKHLMVSCGSKVYLALPGRKSLVNGHCLITTIQHASSVTAVDEDVWEEIMDYRKALTKFFNSQNQDVVFFETATRLHKFPHLVINCVPLPRDVGDMAAIYFKKALLECEAEWSMNKKVIDLKGKNVRKGVPKGLPYFWVDFGMDPGFAHVIEDQQLFPKAFAEEIIGGILDLDHNLWKNPKKEHGDQERKKVMEFLSKWKKFDTVAKR